MKSKKYQLKVKSATLITSILIGLSYLLIPSSARADEFNSFQAGNCPPPALSDSTQLGLTQK